MLRSFQVPLTFKLYIVFDDHVFPSVRKVFKAEAALLAVAA